MLFNWALGPRRWLSSLCPPGLGPLQAPCSQVSGLGPLILLPLLQLSWGLSGLSPSSGRGAVFVLLFAPFPDGGESSPVSVRAALPFAGYGFSSPVERGDAGTRKHPLSLLCGSCSSFPSPGPQWTLRCLLFEHSVGSVAWRLGESVASQVARVLPAPRGSHASVRCSADFVDLCPEDARWCPLSRQMPPLLRVWPVGRPEN